MEVHELQHTNFQQAKSEMLKTEAEALIMDRI